MDKERYDVVIIGAGPAGCSAAIHLAKTGLNIAVIEKRGATVEKICGGGLTTKSIVSIRNLGPDIYDQFQDITQKTASDGAVFYTPDQTKMVMNIPDNEQNEVGFFIKRKIIDDFLFDQLRKHKNIRVFKGITAESTRTDKEGIHIKTSKSILSGEVAIFSDGVNSVIGRNAKHHKVLKKNRVIAARGYFKSSKKIKSGGYAEFYFTQDIVPGYLWIFPMPDQYYNVGFYIPPGKNRQKRESASALFKKILENNPQIRDRFEHLEAVGSFANGVIPVWNHHHILSGERFLVTGDAAALVDPFSGEGIGNALLSGELAAIQVEKCFQSGDFSEKFMKKYNDSIKQSLWPEIKASRRILWIIKRPGIFNRMAKRVIKIDGYEEKLGRVYFDVDWRMELLRPWRIFRDLV